MDDRKFPTFTTTYDYDTFYSSRLETDKEYGLEEYNLEKKRLLEIAERMVKDMNRLTTDLNTINHCISQLEKIKYGKLEPVILTEEDIIS